MKTALVLCVMIPAVLSTSAVADEVYDLISDLTHRDQAVREKAADVLGNLGDPRAVDPLIRALNDTE
jgi:HEAT repeat protein